MTFSLRDLFALMTVLAIVFAIVVPKIVESREQARSTQCEHQLKRIGEGMFAHAILDPARRLCTGATDYRFDGCPDEIGWVADQLKLKVVEPEEFLCPVNPARGSAMLNDLLATSFLDCASCLPDSTQPDSKPGSDLRAAIVARRFLDRGVNTNFAAGWHLVRVAPKFSPYPNPVIVGNGDFRGRQSTLGPIFSYRFEPWRARIALLGDGAAAPKPLAQTLAIGPTLPDGSPDPTAQADTRENTFLAAGELLARTFVTGPATWDPVKRRLIAATGKDDLHAQIHGELSGAMPLPTVARKGYRLDTRAWGAVNRVGKTSKCNMLMGDGSVRSFRDRNGDGFLNPGFPVPPSIETDGEPGFVGSFAELDHREVDTGIWLFNHSPYWDGE